jgi:hypothetical protein
MTDVTQLPSPPAVPAESLPLQWYQRPIPIGLAMLFLAPVGFVLLLMQPRWSWTRKIVILVLLGPICLLESFAFLASMSASSSTSGNRPAVTSHR